LAAVQHPAVPSIPFGHWAVWFVSYEHLAIPSVSSWQHCHFAPEMLQSSHAAGFDVPLPPQRGVVALQIEPMGTPALVTQRPNSSLPLVFWHQPLPAESGYVIPAGLFAA